MEMLKLGRTWLKEPADRGIIKLDGKPLNEPVYTIQGYVKGGQEMVKGTSTRGYVKIGQEKVKGTHRQGNVKIGQEMVKGTSKQEMLKLNRKWLKEPVNSKC